MPPAKFQLTRSGQTEFVICDYTIDVVCTLYHNFCEITHVACRLGHGARAKGCWMCVNRPAGDKCPASLV